MSFALASKLCRCVPVEERRILTSILQKDEQANEMIAKAHRLFEKAAKSPYETQLVAEALLQLFSLFPVGAEMIDEDEKAYLAFTQANLNNWEIHFMPLDNSWIIVTERELPAHRIYRPVSSAEDRHDLVGLIVLTRYERDITPPGTHKRESARIKARNEKARAAANTSEESSSEDSKTGKDDSDSDSSNINVKP